jgi:methionyl-tRNA synthetase
MARPFYVTTPIYYVNDAPHIGHAYTTVNCDAIARWHRLLGDDVFFLTGTDEHGLKIQRAPSRPGCTPRSGRPHQRALPRRVGQLDISNDDFIRTSEPRHYAAVQELPRRIRDNGHIELDTYEGLYCVAARTTTPRHRRPRQLPDPPEAARDAGRGELLLRLSLFEQPLLDWYEANPDCVVPLTKRNEALGFIKQGLQDISITAPRSTGGVPVPWDDRLVFYVWYDALINYCTAIGYGTDQARFDATGRPCIT